MKKNFVEIYALAVCFFTVACIVFYLGFSAWATVRICTPQFTLNSQIWASHQSNDSFKTSGYHLPVAARDQDPNAQKVITDVRERSFAQAISSERRDGLQELIKSLLTLIIIAGVFALHWKVAAHARQNAS